MQVSIHVDMEYQCKPAIFQPLADLLTVLYTQVHVSFVTTVLIFWRNQN